LFDGARIDELLIDGLPLDGLTPGGVGLFPGLVVLSAPGRACSCALPGFAWETGGKAESGLSDGAPAGRRASSTAPHIPQKRKLSELTSPHFGQITEVLGNVFIVV
jgi:hypothetical protein